MKDEIRWNLLAQSFKAVAMFFALVALYIGVGSVFHAIAGDGGLATYMVATFFSFCVFISYKDRVRDAEREEERNK